MQVFLFPGIGNYYVKLYQAPNFYIIKKNLVLKSTTQMNFTLRFQYAVSFWLNTFDTSWNNH